jgi:hypothetical protein
MSKINTIFTFKDGIATGVVAIVNNNHYEADSTHANWNQIMTAIRNDDVEAFVSSIDRRSAIMDYTVGNVRVVGNEIWYANTRLGGVVVDRIFDFMANGLPVEPIMKFVDKLFQNPSHRAVNELYRFLEHKNLPITSEGNFRAYKGLLSDFYSITGGNLTLVKGKINDKGQIYNGVGEEIECVRHQVDDNKENTCSRGLHAGSLEYATGFAQGKMVIVEINPADVVSIPVDCEGQKLRTYKYVVVEEYTAPLDSTYVKTSEFNNNPMPSDVKDQSDNDDTDTDINTDTDCNDCDCKDDEFDNDNSESMGFEYGVKDGSEGNTYDSADAYFTVCSDTKFCIDIDSFSEGYDKGYVEGQNCRNKQSKNCKYHDKRDSNGKFCKGS